MGYKRNILAFVLGSYLLQDGCRPICIGEDPLELHVPPDLQAAFVNLEAHAAPTKIDVLEARPCAAKSIDDCASAVISVARELHL